MRQDKYGMHNAYALVDQLGATHDLTVHVRIIIRFSVTAIGPKRIHYCYRYFVDPSIYGMNLVGRLIANSIQLQGSAHTGQHW